MQNRLISSVLTMLCPELASIDVFFVNDVSDTCGALKKMMIGRAQNDLQPVVVLGFDAVEKMTQRNGGFVLDAPGVFYLRLPASLSHVRSVLRKAARFKASNQGVVDNESIRRYAIQRIRAFKHTCDNVWMSMEGNTNAARSSLNDSPGTKPSSLKEFRQARIERLSEEYSQLEPLATRLCIEGTKQVPNIMAEVIDMIGRIHEDVVSPQNAIELAAKCVKKMQKVAKILSKVKELEHND